MYMSTSFNCAAGSLIQILELDTDTVILFHNLTALGAVKDSFNIT